jgi:hypothetical protein
VRTIDSIDSGSRASGRPIRASGSSRCLPRGSSGRSGVAAIASSTSAAVGIWSATPLGAEMMTCGAEFAQRAWKRDVSDSGVTASRMSVTIRNSSAIDGYGASARNASVNVSA